MLKKSLVIICTALCMCASARSQGTWTQIANYGGGIVTEARAFAIGTKGYIVSTPNLWEYDPATLAWTQMAAFPGATRLSGAAFAIGTKGYFGTGGNLNDFYEYDQATNTWTQKANFGGTGREGAVGISINGKGYIGLGGNYLDDWWEYDTTTDAWTQKANLAGPGRYHAGAFAIGSFGYVSTGFDGNFYNDLWQYDPGANTWAAKANMPATGRDRPVGLAANGRGYIVCGWSGVIHNDAWEYNPVTDSWAAIANYGGVGRYNHCGFVVAGSLYVGTGYSNNVLSDVWKYANACGVQAATVATTCNATCDGTATVTQPDTNAVVSYSWNTMPVQTTPTAIALCAGSYIVTVTDTAGCISSVSVVVTSPPPLTPVMTCTPVSCNGGTNGTACLPAGYTCYLWSTSAISQCINGIFAGTYTATVCDANGCTGTVTGTVTQSAAMAMSFVTNDATCQTCADGNATANISGGQFPYQINWSNGGTGAFIQNLLPGWYTCCITDANNCTLCDSTFISFPSAVNELSNEGITVSPNPFTDFVFIDFKNGILNTQQIKVLDALGKRVDAIMISENQKVKINTKQLKAGIYFIEINVGSERYRYKLLKN